MSLHFLLKAEARTLSVVDVLRMSDMDAFHLFKRLRWGDGDDVVCPFCGTIHTHYFRPAKMIWRCSACGEDFSVTSKTIFAHHKLPLRIYMAAAILFANAVKGISALQMARDLGVQHKTAYVLCHKLREAIALSKDDSPLDGEVHMDGAYVGGSIRPKNKKEDRIDRRLVENQPPDGKRCVLVMREHYTPEELLLQPEAAGAKRTLAFIIKKESKAAIGKLAPEYIAQGAIISADEADAYDPLHAKFEVRRVNHSKEYRADDGTTNNMAESYFSRFRRMQIGQIHKVSFKYLDRYADEVAFREDTRRWSNGDIFLDIVSRCAHALTSRDWAGYWQNNKRAGECLAA